MGPDIEVEAHWDGKLRVFRLPDGTEIRKSKGDGQQPFEIVGAFLKEERQLSDFTLLQGDSGTTQDHPSPIIGRPSTLPPARGAADWYGRG